MPLSAPQTAAAAPTQPATSSPPPTASASARLLLLPPPPPTLLQPPSCAQPPPPPPTTVVPPHARAILVAQLLRHAARRRRAAATHHHRVAARVRRRARSPTHVSHPAGGSTDAYAQSSASADGSAPPSRRGSGSDLHPDLTSPTAIAIANGTLAALSVPDNHVLSLVSTLAPGRQNPPQDDPFSGSETVYSLAERSDRFAVLRAALESGKRLFSKNLEDARSFGLVGAKRLVPIAPSSLSLSTITSGADRSSGTGASRNASRRPGGSSNATGSGQLSGKDSQKHNPQQQQKSQLQSSQQQSQRKNIPKPAKVPKPSFHYVFNSEQIEKRKRRRFDVDSLVSQIQEKLDCMPRADSLSALLPPGVDEYDESLLRSTYSTGESANFATTQDSIVPTSANNEGSSNGIEPMDVEGANGANGIGKENNIEQKPQDSVVNGTTVEPNALDEDSESIPDRNDNRPTPLAVSGTGFAYPVGIPLLSASPQWSLCDRQDLTYKMCLHHMSTMQTLIANNQQYLYQNHKRLVFLCQREFKRWQAPIGGPKQTTKVKKMVKEMLGFWKRNEKEERELRKTAEREAAEERKREEEKREARRQARKLNFLISQTELYSHFVDKNLEKRGIKQPASDTNELQEKDIGSGEKVDFNAIDFDAEDDETLQAKARATAGEALRKQRDATRKFDKEVSQQRQIQLSENTVDSMDFMNPTMVGAEQIEQPKMLTVTLKGYQLKGLNWLANLYEQGINGILADEMGLGKTIQSISLMGYLAESQDIWGPFLIVTPSSTLHNWIQEINRFTPHLKVVPYWGTVKERMILRRDWKPAKLYRKDSSFHVMVTSYNIVVKDEPYFHRVKWQYMILDEAQAIKSSSSSRWKKLLGFNCRNRLLLTGTPIQNSMQELWALLHFIMPTLFDSHEEFSDWFSKDIESHAENKGTLNEHQLRRLHMILKPFMLRRIKRDVENELPEKVEVELKCQLSSRQRKIFTRIKQNSGDDIDETLSNALDMVEDLDSDNRLSKLANLVMQFRKICNHPELFERADVLSSFFCYPPNRMIPPPGSYLETINNNNINGMNSTGTVSASDIAEPLEYHVNPMIEVVLPRIVYEESTQIFPMIKSSFGGGVSVISRLFNIHDRCHINESINTENLISETAVDKSSLKRKAIDLNSSIAVKVPRKSGTKSVGGSSYGFIPLVGLASGEYETCSTSSHFTKFIFGSLEESKLQRKQRYLSLNDFGDLCDNNVLPDINRRAAYTLRIPSRSQQISSMDLTQLNVLGKVVPYFDDDLNVTILPPHLGRVTMLTHELSILKRLEPAYLPVCSAPPRVYCNSPDVIRRWTRATQPRELYAMICGDARLLPSDKVLGQSREVYTCREWITSPYRDGSRSDNGFCSNGLYDSLIKPKSNVSHVGMYPRKSAALDHGDSLISMPSIRNLFMDSGKMMVLETLLPKLKAEGHRLLIFFQMTKMIDIMEEYLNYRKYSYLRLDGSTSIGERRDMVTDWQTNPDLFIFLLSTRAGGVGINLTAADTVIFYDSDWNPTVDQQAMDRCHRLGQTKKVTVYRMITEGTIEERIIVRAKQKGEIQRVVIAGRN